MWENTEESISRITLPKVISHLEKEIEIKTLDDAMKFECLMKIYKKYSWKEIDEALETSNIRI